MKIELFYGIWLFVLEAGWIIYGNTFIYTEESKDCNGEFVHRWAKLDLNVNALRSTAMVLIIYGYFLLIAIVFAILFSIFAYRGYQAYIKPDLANKALMDD